MQATRTLASVLAMVTKMVLRKSKVLSEEERAEARKTSRRTTMGKRLVSGLLDADMQKRMVGGMVHYSTAKGYGDDGFSSRRHLEVPDDVAG